MSECEEWNTIVSRVGGGAPCIYVDPAIVAFLGFKGARKAMSFCGSNMVSAPEKDSGGGYNWRIIASCTVVGGVVCFFLGPTIVGALGFKSLGIAASSYGAQMMSAAAIAGGGGVKAGSTVAVLQAIGAGGAATSVFLKVCAGIGLGTGAVIGVATSDGGQSQSWYRPKKRVPRPRTIKEWLAQPLAVSVVHCGFSAVAIGMGGFRTMIYRPVMIDIIVKPTRTEVDLSTGTGIAAKLSRWWRT